jgi:hypothetical protein
LVEGEGAGHGVVGWSRLSGCEEGELVGGCGHQGVVSGEQAGWLWLLEVVGSLLLSGEQAGGGGGGQGWGSQRRRKGLVVVVGVVGEGIGQW